ncbi:hypothetical protein [Streptomyces buecherae]|uniref:hypothetical protein n=1 Tax=Streptomyces buecherae TaxID=2763006 RepID=UPI001E43C1DC|nr:hypothetical protein [Streptomyces buecherae]
MSQRTSRSRRTSRAPSARPTRPARRTSRTHRVLRAHRVHDLIVFLAALGTAVGLVLGGVAPESLATIAVAVSGLYAAWRGGGDRSRSPEGR